MANLEIIKLDDVWKIYTIGDNKVYALQGLNLSVKKGEFLIVMGPSGSGKSTAVNMIGCLDKPTRGAIFLDGKNISKLNESSLAQIRGKKIGFIFQTFNLISTLNIVENVALPMLFQGKNKEEAEERAKSLLKLVGLGDRMHHKPNQLSGGQQQRVAIARSLINDPEVIIADEPTGNLDSKTGKNIIQLLKQLNKENKKTIIIVTHDDEFSKIGDRVVKIRDGKTTDEIKNRR